MASELINCANLFEPIAKSDTNKLNVLPSLQYTNQDFSSLKTRLVEYIQEKFADEFTDFVEGSLAFVIIETQAFIGDTISFKADQIANEIFIDTVTEIENAFRLAKLVGFYPVPPIAARSLVSATIQSPLLTDLVIAPGVQIEIPSALGNLTFEIFAADSNNNPLFDDDIVIPAGNISNISLVGLEGGTRVDNFIGTGAPNQNFELNFSPVLYQSVRVDVNGSRWDQVNYFTESQPKNEYRLEYSSDYSAFIIFGNGSGGRIPGSGAQIVVTYRVGGGPNGNVIVGAIDAQRSFNVDGLLFSVPVGFRNYTKGEYGYSGDTVDDIRMKLPAYLRTQDRCVTASDYKTLSEQFVSPYNGQIGKALATVRNMGCSGNIIELYVLAKNGDDGLFPASDELKAELTAYVSERKMINHYLCLQDGVVLSVDVTLDLVIDKFFKKFRDELDQRIRNAITDFFSLNNWDYGESLADTDIMKALANIIEIISMSVSFTTIDPENSGKDVTTKFYEIIRPDQIFINMIFE